MNIKFSNVEKAINNIHGGGEPVIHVVLEKDDTSYEKEEELYNNLFKTLTEALDDTTLKDTYLGYHAIVFDDLNNVLCDNDTCDIMAKFLIFFSHASLEVWKMITGDAENFIPPKFWLVSHATHYSGMRAFYDLFNHIDVFLNEDSIEGSIRELGNHGFTLFNLDAKEFVDPEWTPSKRFLESIRPERIFISIDGTEKEEDMAMIFAKAYKNCYRMAVLEDKFIGV